MVSGASCSTHAAGARRTAHKATMTSGHQQVRIALLGNPRVGKHAFMTRYVEDSFDEADDDIRSDMLETKVADPHGSSVWVTLQPNQSPTDLDASFQHKKAPIDAAIVLFASDDQQSFDAIQHWIDTVNTKCSKDVPICLVQSKIDLTDATVLDPDNVQTSVKQMKRRLYRTSAKENLNIKEVIDYLLVKIATRKAERPLTPQPPSPPKEQRKSSAKRQNSGSKLSADPPKREKSADKRQNSGSHLSADAPKREKSAEKRQNSAQKQLSIESITNQVRNKSAEKSSREKSAERRDAAKEKNGPVKPKPIKVVKRGSEDMDDVRENGLDSSSASATADPFVVKRPASRSKSRPEESVDADDEEVEEKKQKRPKTAKKKEKRRNSVQAESISNDDAEEETEKQKKKPPRKSSQQIFKERKASAVKKKSSSVQNISIKQSSDDDSNSDEDGANKSRRPSTAMAVYRKFSRQMERPTTAIRNMVHKMSFKKKGGSTKVKKKSRQGTEDNESEDEEVENEQEEDEEATEVEVQKPKVENARNKRRLQQATSLGEETKPNSIQAKTLAVIGAVESFDNNVDEAPAPPKARPKTGKARQQTQESVDDVEDEAIVEKVGRKKKLKKQNTSKSIESLEDDKPKKQHSLDRQVSTKIFLDDEDSSKIPEKRRTGGKKNKCAQM